MTNVQVTLPDNLKDFIDRKVEESGYKSSSDYIRELIRQDQLREGERQLGHLMRDGIESGPAKPADTEFWTARRAMLRK
jgi:antitoxin ParD1/3/4